MNYPLLVSKYLSDKQIEDGDHLNVELFLSGDQSGWRFSNVAAPSIAELEALNTQVEQEVAQDQINQQARIFLASTDWQIIRHQDQLLSGETPSLSEPELQTLLAQRKAARESIV